MPGVCMYWLHVADTCPPRRSTSTFCQPVRPRWSGPGCLLACLFLAPCCSPAESQVHCQQQSSQQRNHHNFRLQQLQH
jgi:hypothetical protein